MAKFNLPFRSLVVLSMWVAGIYFITKYRACKASSECQSNSSDAVAASIVYVGTFPLQVMLVEEWYGRVPDRPWVTRLGVMCWYVFFLMVNTFWLLFLFFEYGSVAGLFMAVVFTLLNVTLGLCTWIYWDNIIRNSGAGHLDLLETSEHVGAIDEEAASHADGNVLSDVTTSFTTREGSWGGESDA